MNHLEPGERSFGAVATLAVALAACGGDQPIEQPSPLYGDNAIEYPLDLWDEGVEGEAVLRVMVTESGAVDSVAVLQSSGHSGLDSAAVAGVKDLQFSPARSDGKRTAAWARVPVRFSKKPRTREPGSVR